MGREHSHRAVCYGLGGETRPVGLFSRKCGEEIPYSDSPRVELDVVHVGSGPHQVAGASDVLYEVHQVHHQSSSPVQGSSEILKASLLSSRRAGTDDSAAVRNP